ncbi:hypothetical protein JHN59_37045 [Streptomyces sp. MBT49]|uniref:hypothetical protein n=1 Tax=unclassified Streptomyces TaxID=2593676 RepID=UPI00190A5F98|nr:MULTISPECIES: hypothetical protein [unclassified Streptomyces]MBK3630308.1 hypothetical protein [Streptomyces sp. MBT49]MBK3634695.1 hypothetical protein [Streptomyces sp. MBT97]
MSPRRNPRATHGMPLAGMTRTPCCGILPNEVPRYHLITPDLDAVTCVGRDPGIRRPVRDLVEVVLTTTRRIRPTRSRLFLPHGDDDGHWWDVRCALCTADVDALADAVTAALIAGFPDNDVAHLRAIKARRPPGQPSRAGSPLRNLVAVLLTTTAASNAPPGTELRPHGGSSGHPYDRRCALCIGDARALASAVEAALTRALPAILLRARTAATTPPVPRRGATGLTGPPPPDEPAAGRSCDAGNCGQPSIGWRLYRGWREWLPACGPHMEGPAGRTRIYDLEEQP